MGIARASSNLVRVVVDRFVYLLPPWPFCVLSQRSARLTTPCGASLGFCLSLSPPHDVVTVLQPRHSRRWRRRAPSLIHTPLNMFSWFRSIFGTLRFVPDRFWRATRNQTLQVRVRRLFTTPAHPVTTPAAACHGKR